MPKQTKYLTFQGKCMWACLDIPDTKYDIDGKWTIRLYPTQESHDALLKLKEEGMRNHIKQDDEGYSVTFSRPVQKMIKGRIKAFNAPMIEDRDGNVLPRGTKIGNGSDVTVSVECFYIKPNKAATNEIPILRLMSVRIDSLVPYTRDDYPRSESRAAKALDRSPPQPF